MSNLKIYKVILVLIFSSLIFNTIHAEERNKELDSLFDQLKTDDYTIA